jgi:hypothetical protein
MKFNSQTNNNTNNNIASFGNSANAVVDMSDDLDPELRERVHRLMLRADINGQGVITYAGMYYIYV